MGETEPSAMENDGDDGDDSYANAYLDDAEESDDAELAEMLAKVQSIQQVEGRLQPTEQPAPAEVTDVKGSQAGASAETLARLSPSVSTPAESRKSQSLVKSPSATSSAGAYRSQDGITTIPRSALSARAVGAGALLGIKKAAIYEEKLLQAVTTSQAIEKLRQKAVAAPLATIKKRIEALSAPPTKSTARKFATDDEEQHCRFQARKTQRAKASRDDFDSAGGAGVNFVSRMEAAERNRQKKLELSRGESDYNARLDKKSCSRCGIPQSYAEFRDKKKKCQMCGVEFRFLNAWGDVEQRFTSRMVEASRAQAEKREQIFAQVTADETNRLKVNKTAKQLQYEKRIAMRHNKQTFLDRNYKPSSDSKAKTAQLELDAKRKAVQTTLKK